MIDCRYIYIYAISLTIGRFGLKREGRRGNERIILFSSARMFLAPATNHHLLDLLSIIPLVTREQRNHFSVLK